MSKKNILLLIGFLLILAIAFYATQQHEQKRWIVTKKGILEYPDDRGTVEYTSKILESNPNYTLKEVFFTSIDTKIHGLIRIPVSDKPVPAAVLLPGATVDAKGEQGLAKVLSSMGYASLAIDQRNLGVVDFERDYQLFMENKEPIEHKMVYDALKGYDVLRMQPEIDPNKIFMIGESNGGRFAIIATALDKSIYGVIAISTSGYNTMEYILSNPKIPDSAIRFYKSIDPETYLKEIPPRKLVMMHSTNDPIIPFMQAKNTFAKAREPKAFYSENAKTHGYTGEMEKYLEKELLSDKK
ncbi:MAG TPA: alpha/beta hydrolase [Methanosarcinales archaeon]|nr:alpha/beta hydrolase [Methanosarcinales archaeon]